MEIKTKIINWAMDVKPTKGRFYVYSLNQHFHYDFQYFYLPVKTRITQVSGLKQHYFKTGLPNYFNICILHNHAKPPYRARGRMGFGTSTLTRAPFILCLENGSPAQDGRPNDLNQVKIFAK
ncbi:hypothetical protein L0337_22230 [candidate division KSB1 bacterium]|nr:hypothetical protein [candidate division KSB1 bacterium]